MKQQVELRQLPAEGSEVPPESLQADPELLGSFSGWVGGCLGGWLGGWLAGHGWLCIFLRHRTGQTKKETELGIPN